MLHDTAAVRPDAGSVIHIQFELLPDVDIVAVIKIAALGYCFIDFVGV
jgi:hypothetical protein